MIILKGIGAIFFCFAFMQWITFDYPDVNPFYPGSIFAPGMFGQLVNFLLVIALAFVGMLFWNADKWRKSDKT